MAYTSLLQSDFNESLGLGCEVLLDDNCTADLNNNKSVDQEETIEISDYVPVISTNEYMDIEPAISTHDLSNIHVDVLISTGEHSNIEPSPSTEAKEVHCDVCNKTFSTKANLKRHIRRHNGSMLECSECSKQFDTKYHLENHRKLSHTAFNYKCSKCPKTFKSKVGLKNHENQHIKRFKYLCPQCGKGFNYTADIKGHKSMHEGTKPHSCDKCGAKFTNIRNKRRHVFSCGVKVKGSNCDICNKSFKCPRYLTSSIPKDTKIQKDSNALLVEHSINLEPLCTSIPRKLGIINYVCVFAQRDCASLKASICCDKCIFFKDLFYMNILLVSP
ncbi:zinc finger protein 62-like [Mytilus trossulus]|uniref:zinc finger protein 62-like n=1 Tax=Mytilus trossulus TaxID=6551 RepID=UPI003004AE38